MIAVRRPLSVGADEVWNVLVDLDAWPGWGPSVRGATLDDGGRRLHAAAHGTVRTAVGAALPFRVDDWEEGRRWSWTVAGIPATGHGVEPAGAGSVATIEVPWWALPYAAVCRVALGRIGDEALRRRSTRG